MKRYARAFTCVYHRFFLPVFICLAITLSGSAQNCTNFKVSLESRTCIAGTTIFIWSVKNLAPGNGTHGTPPGMQSWAVAAGSCVTAKNLLYCGFSHTKSKWKKYIPEYVVGKSGNCISSNAIRFMYGTSGAKKSYYLLVLKGYFTSDSGAAYLRTANGCCTTKINGIGCYCGGVSAPVVQGGERCGAGVVTLSAVGCPNGTLTWYANVTGGSAVATGSSFSPQVTATTTYFVACTSGSCTSARVPVTAIIHELPTQPFTRGDTRCGTGLLNLSAIGCTDGVLKWYNSATETIPFTTGTTYQPYLLYTGSGYANVTSSYFVSCAKDGCESERSVVTATLQFPGMVPATVENASRCGAGQVTLTASCPNDGSPGWFTGPGTPPIGFGNSITTYVEYTTTYYVSCPGCGTSAGRVPVTATVNDCGVATKKLFAEKPQAAIDKLIILAQPNPFAGHIIFTLRSPETSTATLEIYTLEGRKIATVFAGLLVKGEQTINYTVPETIRSAIVYRLTNGREVRSGVLLPSRQ